MMTLTKPLSIMHQVYDKNHIEDDSLLSPPLTPTEPPKWDHYPRKNRKAFIESYCRMVPYLRSTHGHDRVFALNVYRDLLLMNTNKQDDDQEKEKRIDKCTRLDKPAVIPTKKRKLNPSNVHKDKQPCTLKKRRVSSVLPTGKDAASAFDSIDIETNDTDFYPPGWVPSQEALDTIPVKVSWKGKNI